MREDIHQDQTGYVPPGPTDMWGQASTAFELSGADALPLLHRISTQKLDDLAVAQARTALFCDFRGRLLYRAAVVVAPGGGVWLVAEDSFGAALAAFLDRHVFREDVRIADRSEQVLVRASASDQPAMASYDPARGWPQLVEPGDGVGLVVEHGTAPGPDDPAGMERARILAGRAAHGREIVEDFNPFEVGLGSAVHLDKGCFTGQESLMRLTTYGSVKRQMVRVEGSGPPPRVPAEVVSEGERAGTLTSAVEDAIAERWLGLAVVRIEVLERGRPLAVGDRPLVGVQRLPMPRALGRP